MNEKEINEKKEIDQNTSPNVINFYDEYKEELEDNDGQSSTNSNEGTATYKMASMQIANTITGAAILSIPIILRYLGILIGVSFLIFVACATIYSVYLLIRCKEITGKSGYSMFAKITLGSSGSILVKIIIIISNLGICCAYLKIFGETMQTTFQAFVSSDSYWVTNWHNYIYILFISVIMIFFVFAKSMDKFKQISFIGVISISIFLIFLSVMFFSKLYLNILPEINKDFLFPQCTAVQALQSLPTVFLAFSFQFNVFPIFYSLQNKTMNEMLKASIIGVIFCFVLFLLTGIFGFLMFGTRMNDTILKELFLDMVIYKENHSFIKYIIIIINFSFVMSTLMGFPIMFYSLKVNFLNSILFCRKRCFKIKELGGKGKVEQKVEISNENAENNKEDSPMNKKDSNFSSLTEKIVIVSLYFSIVLITILIPNLMMIFNVIGSTSANFISIIFPNLFYIRLTHMGKLKQCVVASYILLIIGFAFLIISLGISFLTEKE